TTSSSAGSKPNGTRLRIDSFGLPWNMPQSTRTFARSVAMRNVEPVTVVAPPRKVMSIARMVTGRAVGRVSRRAEPASRHRYGRAVSDEDERVDGDGDEQQRQIADRVLVQPDRALGGRFLGGPTPPQGQRVPDEHRAETDRRAEVDQAHPGDRPEDEG